MNTLDGQQLDGILEFAVTSARAAGQVLLTHLGKLGPGAVSRKTSFRDLVTQADLASEALLVERIRASYPGHSIQSEEAVCDQDVGGLRWYLDPLDGTVNFVHSLPMFAVSMGLVQDGLPLLGVVYIPVLDECFYARRGGGAWLDGRRLEVSTTAELSEAILATGFAYRRGEVQPSNLENFARFFFDVRGLRRMGAAAVDLAYVAAGRLDGYWEYHLSPHDVAAGAVLVREAGGLVSDPSGGQEWLQSGAIVAAGEGLHGLIRGRLRAQEAGPLE